MRITDVCAFYTPHGGGVRTYIEQKLAYAPTAGHDLTVIAPGPEAGVDERGPHARIVYLKSPRLIVDRKYGYFNNQAKLFAALDAARPDVVEVSSPWRSASEVGRWPGTAPRFLIMHSDPLSAFAYRWFRPLFSRATIDRGFEAFWAHLRNLGAAYDQVICANRDLHDRLVAGGIDNCMLSPMGVEPGLFTPANRSVEVRRDLLAMCDLPPEATLLLGLGRLSAEKRWPLVVKAVTHAGRDHPLGLVLLGEGGQRDRLVRAIAGNPHIRIVQPERDRRNFARILASADALVHGCEAETYCLVGAEARASGLPVIVPDRGGAADHAAEGGGLTYASGDPAACSAAIEKWLEAPLRPPPETARTLPDHFAELFGYYESVLAGRGAA